MGTSSIFVEVDDDSAWLFCLDNPPSQFQVVLGYEDDVLTLKTHLWRMAVAKRIPAWTLSSIWDDWVS